MAISWNDYYVTHTGAAGGSGTLGSPWLNLQGVMTDNATYPVTAPARIYIQGGTGGSPTTMTITSDINMVSRAGVDTPVHYIWDDGTVWGSNTDGFELRTRNAFGSEIINDDYTTWYAEAADGSSTLTYSTAYNGSVFGYFEPGAHGRVIGVTFTRDSSRLSDDLSVFATGNGSGSNDQGGAQFIRCTFKPRSGNGSVLLVEDNGYKSTIVDCTFDLTDTDSDIVLFQAGSTFDTDLIEVVGGEVTNAGASAADYSIARPSGKVAVRGLDLGGISAELPDATVGDLTGDFWEVRVQGYDGENSFLRQTRQGVIQAGLQGSSPFYPGRTAQAPTTGASSDEISYRVQPTTRTANIGYNSPLEVPLPILRNTLSSDARKVLSVYALVDTLWAGGLDDENCWVEFRWRDDSGNWQTNSTRGTGSALTTDAGAAANWTATTYGAKSYDGVVFSYTLGVSDLLQAGTNIEAVLYISTNATAGVNLFVDPAIEVADP